MNLQGMRSRGKKKKIVPIREEGVSDLTTREEGGQKEWPHNLHEFSHQSGGVSPT